MNLTKPQKLANAGKVNEALASLPEAGMGNDPRADIIRARIELDNDLPGEALAVVNKTIAKHPDFLPAYLFQAIAYYDSGDISAALGSINKALELQPRNDLAQSYQALFQYAADNEQDAVASWKQFGFSDNLNFRIRLIEFLEKTWLETRRYFEQRSYGLDQTEQKPSGGKAIKCFYKHDFAGVIAHSPPPPTTNVELAHLAAFAFEMLNDYEAAQTYLDGFADQNDQWPDALIAMQARILARKGNLAEAARQFARITTLGPEDYGSNYYLGVICLAYDKRSEARNFFRRALTAYLPDTLDYQWWKIEKELLAASS